MRYTRRRRHASVAAAPNHSASSALAASASSSSLSSACTPTHDTETSVWPAGAYDGATSDGKQQLFTRRSLAPEPSRKSTGSGTAASGAAKYTHAVPTPAPALEGELSSASPRRAPACGPSTATTTPPRASTRDPSASVAPPASTPTTRALQRTDPSGSPAQSWSEMAPMPRAGSVLAPSASMRITNSKSRDVVPSWRSKKMPPRKGMKKRSIIAREKPAESRRSAMVVSGAANFDSALPSSAPTRTSPTRTLSATLPIGFTKDKTPSTGCRNGSATRWNAPFQRTNAPA
mmetsp:Transcript_25771/g.84820  ORF Transcript_25771/g.84820 Transcript_25771/m.84820 type:complete len:290 (+) Transcript_25771:271-1140(+)